MKLFKEKETRSLKVDIIVAALVFVLSGLVFALFPEQVNKTICYAVGVALCIWGVISLIMYFLSDRSVVFTSYGLVKAIALLTLGIVVTANPDRLLSVLPMMFGIALIIDGALKLQYSVDLARIKGKYWWVVLIAAIVIITVGAIIVFDRSYFANTFTRILGIFMIISGLSDIAVVIYVGRVVRYYIADTIEVMPEQK